MKIVRSSIPNAFELSKALRRASLIIDWMMPYIGNMCPPNGGISELNEHCIFAERHGYMPKKNDNSTKGRPLNQRPPLQSWDEGKS